ncbi:MAG: hypothetical protein JO139_15340, partial [Alphaproteobacteria bacterium]|nr:hypothetical protein [Alphaproteobacteria bacterium]
GEGLADTGAHLVDRVHEMLFPEQPLDWQRDIEILAPTRWPTAVSLPQFRELTGEGKWPDDLAPWIRGDVLEYLCNGRVDYRVRGIHVRLEVRWGLAGRAGRRYVSRGTRCRLAVRQGPAERFRPELYVLPDENIGTALQRRITELQSSHPGIATATLGSEWRIALPEAIRVGHDAAFGAFTRRFLACVADPASLPARERPNLLANTG